MNRTPTMKVTQGLMHGIVLQRTRDGVCDTLVSGMCRTRGTLYVTVRRGRAVLKAWRQTPIGDGDGRRFSGRLKGLPVGGPYDLDLQILSAKGVLEQTAVRNVLVGDVWVVAGQSNAQGCGLLREAPPVEPMVRAFYLDDRWRVARDPIHNMWRAVAPVHAMLNGGVRPGKNTITGAGPGVSFAQCLFQSTGIPQGLLACAHGGTSMKQWDPGLKVRGDGSLYGAMLERIQKNGGRVAGVVWYQGESDANEADAPHYTRRMKEWVAALRRDLRDPGLPVVLAQIGRVIAWPENGAAPWNSIQDQQRKLPLSIRRCLVVPTVDLPLDDGIHLSGSAQRVLGGRMAEAMLAFLRRPGKGRRPVTFHSVTVEPEKRRPMTRVRVRFDHVVGKLVALGRPVGFSALDENGVEQVYDTQLAGREAIVKLLCAPGRVGRVRLWHGRGTNPVCNIRDEAGRPLPVFGPVALGRPRAVTPMIRKLRVSRWLPSAGKLHDLTYPTDKTALELRPREFAGEFCDLHLELGKLAPQDVVVFYACDFDCSEAMKLRILLGYDGPVKVWVDGIAVYHDPDGTNPAIPETGKIPVSVGPGRHEILVALGSNHGKAWGIFLALERRGLSRSVIERGPEHYRMPTVLG